MFCREIVLILNQQASGNRWVWALLLLIITLKPSFVLGANPALQDLPAFPAPPRTSSSWIAENILLNNTAMSIKEFIYSGSAEQFEAFYKQQWPGPFFNKSYFGDETLFGYIDNDYHYSVRFKERFGRISGQMVVSKLDAQPPQSLRTDLPLPMGSTITQIIHARDAGRLSESITVSNYLSKNGNARYMLTELRHLGWLPERNNPSIGHNRALQLEFSKQASLIQITLSELQNATNKSTQMLIHWIK